MATSTLGSGTLVLAGTTSGTTTVTATAVAGTTTLTLPAATDTLVGKATTDTLTNKTLTGAAMNGTLGATTPSTVAATTISASSTATFAAGAAGTPSITTSGDTNTGIFFPAADTIAFAEGGAESMRLDSSGNLGLGVTPNITSLGGTYALLAVGKASGSGIIMGQTDLTAADSTAAQFLGKTTGASGYQLLGGMLVQTDGSSTANAVGRLTFYTATGGSLSERARIDSSGNLLVGTTSALNGAARLDVSAPSGNNVAATFKNDAGANQWVTQIWNAGTSGDNGFVQFATETSYAGRGSITYNRAGGLVAYNVTSDYRAKDIYGPVTGSGALIDSVPVYMGKMKGATQERPMFIAHEVPAYAHTGVKDAVDAEGNPVYQQMDTSALVPVMWAEIQSLRKRLAAAGI
jgi:hypothetical protein